MKKLLGLAAAVLVSVGLTGGIVAASSGSIDTTGPDSSNEVKVNNKSDIDLDNDTRVSANIEAEQDAESGDAKVWHNTTGGDAESGDAENQNDVEASLEVDNSGSSAAALACGCANGSGNFTGSIERTGPDSWNKVEARNESRVNVNNNTTVTYTNSTTQNAKTGDATVAGNTTGGNATTGSASNSSSSSFSLSVKN